MVPDILFRASLTHWHHRLQRALPLSPITARAPHTGGSVEIIKLLRSPYPLTDSTLVYPGRTCQQPMRQVKAMLTMKTVDPCYHLTVISLYGE